MPLTDFQQAIAVALADLRTEDSYLAGGAALHITPNGTRYSNDLDYFHDSEERVASAFSSDRARLEELGYDIVLALNQPGYIRAEVSREGQSTKVEWAHDSAWRFLPVVADPKWGYLLHPIDLAVNKVLALAGRDEPRDYLDVHHIHETTLSLGPLVWAATGKDPGFTPLSLLEQLKRRGRYQAEDFARLHLAKDVDLPTLKTAWLSMLRAAEAFVLARPPNEAGCLYYDPSRDSFVDPESHDGTAVPHHGRPGGVLPKIVAVLVEQKT